MNENRYKGATFTCLTPGCGEEFHLDIELAKELGESPGVKGLCNRCYRHAAQTVREGKTTWKELNEKGLAFSSRRWKDELGGNMVLTALERIRTLEAALAAAEES
jgi:bacterioferritin-associated ferredoxin